MSAEEVGIYMRLLCQQWSKGSLPDDINKLMRLSGGKKKAVEAVASKFLKGGDGLLRNERLERERIKQKSFSESRQASAMHRWSKRNASASVSHDGSNALQSSSSVLGQERESPRVPQWQKSVEDAIAFCVGAAVPEEFIRRVWLQHDGTTWRDSQGRSIGNFKSYVSGRFQTERSYRIEKEAKVWSKPAVEATPLRQRWEENDEGLSWNQFREKYQQVKL